MAPVVAIGGRSVTGAVLAEAPRPRAALEPARAVPAALVALAVAGCGGGGSASTGSSVAPSPTHRVIHTTAATALVLRLDELPAAGFTATTAVTPVDQATAASGDSAVEAAMRSAGFRDAASARYFRTVPVLRTSNGPIDVTSTVVRLGSPGGAGAVLDAISTQLDAVSGAIPTSSGPLGDGGHATVVMATDQGVSVAQATLVWRSGDLVSLLVIRERDTGSSLQDALLTAQPQVLREQA